MKSNILVRTGKFLFYRQYEVDEFLLGLLGIFWGLWVSNPLVDSFSSPLYAAFSNLFPEYVWGIGVAALGLLTIIAAVCKHKIKFRGSMLLINIIVWTFITTKFAISAIVSTAVPIYTMVVLTVIWMYLKVTIFPKMLDDKDSN